MLNSIFLIIFSLILVFIVEKIYPKIKPTVNYLDKFEYVPILTANIYADLLIILITFLGVAFNSKTLVEWYKKYRLSAMIADILIGVLYMLLARYLIYLFRIDVSLTGFALIAVAIQIVFDLLFYGFFQSVPRGVNQVLDFFKDYAKEVGTGALIGDAFLVIFAVLISAILNTQSFDFNIVALIVSMYLVPYILYMK